MYTLLDRNGHIRYRNLSLIDAAKEILTYDDYDYTIKKIDNNWELWVTICSKSCGGFNILTDWRKSSIAAINFDSEYTVTLYIYEKVIKNSEWWCNQECMLDDEYDNYVKDI